MRPEDTLQKSYETILLPTGLVIVKVFIEPMGAVRLSSSDRWKKRPRAQKYFDWKNRFKAIISKSIELQAVINDVVKSGGIAISTYHQVPESWSKKKKLSSYGGQMRSKPDWDNVAKAVCDVLFKEDSHIANAVVYQFWCMPDEPTHIAIASL